MKKFIIAALPLLLISLSAQAQTRFEQCAAHSHLYFKNCGLEDSDIPEIIKYLQKNPPAEYEDVTLSQNNITDAGLTQLLSQVTIPQLDISENKITDASMPAVMNLTQAHLDKNNITDKGAAILAKSSTLIELSLNETKITDEGANAIGQNSNINYIFLEGDGITDKGVTSFAKRTEIANLDLSNNNISDDGAAALSTLQFDAGILELGHNNIGDKGAIALAKNHTNVTLTYNHISDVGMQAFIDNSPSDQLKIPELEGNQLTDRSVDALCNIQADPYVYTGGLSIGNNKITLKGIKKLIQCRNYNNISLSNSHYGDGVAELFGTTNFTMLDLSGNDITDAGIKLLMKNHQWSILYLMDNQITDKGFNEMLVIKHYDSLFLEGNKITDDAMNALLQSDNRIEDLGIGENLVTEAMMEKLDGSKQVGEVSEMKG